MTPHNKNGEKVFRKLIRNIEQTIETEQLAGINEIYSMALDNEPLTLDELSQTVSRCTRCALSSDRRNLVFGEGNARADLMFIGEAPGKEEDRQGRPFVGRAGKLLTKILNAMGLERQDVYIANILKCRPPGNRDPRPEEIAVCSPYLIKQIEIIGPKVICTLGKFASQTLLETDKPISRMRGRFYYFHGIKLMPTYHPAYLLRNSSGKKDVWKDMKLIAGELGIRVPGRNRKKQG